MPEMPEREPLEINVRRKIRVKPKLKIQVARKLPIKATERKPKGEPDEPAMSLFQRAMERKLEDLRQRVLARDPTLKTTTRMPFRDRRQTEQTLYSRAFAA